MNDIFEISDDEDDTEVLRRVSFIVTLISFLVTQRYILSGENESFRGDVWHRQTSKFSDEDRGQILRGQLQSIGWKLPSDR